MIRSEITLENRQRALKELLSFSMATQFLLQRAEFRERIGELDVRVIQRFDDMYGGAQGALRARVVSAREGNPGGFDATLVRHGGFSHSPALRPDVGRLVGGSRF